MAQAAQLKVIEWHGLDHVPHGDLDTADRIAQSTLDAGLALAAYGSYYVVGESESQGLSFTTVLQTAKALRAPMVRVWAGNQSPDDASRGCRAHISDEARRIADLAAEEKIKLVFEFHNGTLTETGESCAAFMETVDHANARAYWQACPRVRSESEFDSASPSVAVVSRSPCFPLETDSHGSTSFGARRVGVGSVSGHGSAAP